MGGVGLTGNAGCAVASYGVRLSVACSSSREWDHDPDQVYDQRPERELSLAKKEKRSWQPLQSTARLVHCRIYTIDFVTPL